MSNEHVELRGNFPSKYHIQCILYSIVYKVYDVYRLCWTMGAYYEEVIANAFIIVWGSR